MKVALIDSVCKYGSTGEITYNLYNYLNTQGQEATVFYGRGEVIKENNIFKFGLDWETYLHAFLARITGYNGCFSFFSTNRLIEKIDEFKPDVIHLQELHAYFVNIRPLIECIKEKRIPVVWTFHCEYMYTGKCGYAGSCENWIYECDNCPAVKEYPKSIWFDRTREMFLDKKRLLRDLDAVYVTPSAFFADRVKRSFLKDKHIETVHNGINTNIYYPRRKGTIRSELGISDDKRIILSVAPYILNERKGGSWVIELAKRDQDKSIEYVLVGHGEKISKRSDNITIVPLIKDKNRLAEIYSEACCFVLCSRHETFSLTCAEALCCGVPVAGFKCDAPETIFEKPYAQFVDYGDLESLQQAIRKQMVLDSEMVGKYGRKHFANVIMCSSYMRIYKELAGE
nr:glycosyltransferase [uncultured Acetatifactor sp.]